MTLVLHETIPDEPMMFGQGELEVYRPRIGFYPDVPSFGLLKDLKGAFA